jgi:hypothetical protein
MKNKFNLPVLSSNDIKSNINPTNTNFIYNYTYPDVKLNIRCYVNNNNNNTIIFPQYIKLGISLYIKYKL